MKSSSKKDARREAARAERERRWRLTEDESPLHRASLQTLLDQVAERVMSEGHDSTFRWTEDWLRSEGHPVDPVLTFLREHRVVDDYSLLIEGTPYQLFGPTDDRLVWMPIARESLDALIAELEGARCGDTHARTREFLVRNHLPVARTLAALLALGGGRDCEVVLNVDPEAIYRSRPEFESDA